MSYVPPEESFQRKLLAAIATKPGGWTSRTLAAQFGKTRAQISRTVWVLRQKGLVAPAGPGRASVPKPLHPTDRGRHLGRLAAVW